MLTYIRGLVKLEGIEGRRVPEDGTKYQKEERRLPKTYGTLFKTCLRKFLTSLLVFPAPYVFTPGIQVKTASSIVTQSHASGQVA